MKRSALGLIAVAVFASACSTQGTPSSIAPKPSTTLEATTTTIGMSTTTATTTTALPTTTTTAAVADTRLDLEPVAEGFTQPVFALAFDGRLYVVEQPGTIWVIDGGDARMFLDIRDAVAYGGERGLLGLAFHPAHDLFYVDYIGLDGATHIAEYGFDDTGADSDSARELLRIPQPARNHNGGMIAFGPDGDLWIGMGDGGGSDDRYGNGQRGDTLLGAMLRIEVGPEVTPYGVAEDYGFEAAEVWAIGLRNPWRFAFDGRDLWIADVGQNAREEVDRVSVDDRLLNFGWPLHEGFSCYRGGSRCDAPDLTPPVYEYRHAEGCSITGGYVYRGRALPQLTGHYFFSDFCSGFIRSIAPSGEVFDWTEQTGSLSDVTSFGVDVDGELLVVSGSGTIYRLVEG
jgi:glucose/arabinose dehydrogenase